MSRKLMMKLLKTIGSLIFYAIVIFGLCYAFVQCYQFAFLAFSNPAYDKNDAVYHNVVVAEQQSSLNTMKNLQSEGMIENAYAGYVRYQFSKYKGKIVPGTYRVRASMTIDEILSVITREEINASGEATSSETTTE